MLRKGHPVLLQAHPEIGLATAVLEAASRIVEGMSGRHSRFEERGCGQNYHRRYLLHFFAATRCQNFSRTN